MRSVLSKIDLVTENEKAVYEVFKSRPNASLTVTDIRHIGERLTGSPCIDLVYTLAKLTRIGVLKVEVYGGHRVYELN